MRFLLAAVFCLTLGFALGSPAPGPRIIGGGLARAGQLPFVAALYITTSDGTFFCSGVLINHSWILTTAQCVEGALGIVIRLGATSLTANEPGLVRLSTDQFVLHPDYAGGLDNNIAAIKLRLPITYSTYVKPIDFLPTTELNTTSRVIASGWGQIDDVTPGVVDELRWVTLVPLTDAECRLAFGSAITTNLLCAEGNYNQGICNGDNGGPLIDYVNRGHTELVGLASFQSQRGCEATDPSGFVKILPYKDWILATTEI